MHVCHLGKYYPPAYGGMETHVRTLARAQAGLGVRAQVVCVNHAAGKGPDRTWSPFPATATVHEIDGPVAVLRAGRWTSLARLDVCPNLYAVLRRFGDSPIDLFHLHTPNPMMMLALILLRPRQPLIITHHSDIVQQTTLRHALRPFEKWVYARAERILSTSVAYAAGSAVLRRYQATVEPLPLGVDLTPYVNPSAAACHYADRLRARYAEPLWLCVGRLTYYKGLHVAIEALADVPGTLLIVGTGPLEAELRRQASERKVAQRIAWLGPVGADELVGAYTSRG
jgi:glycosyltransferase involved in cell wall biosynthesis